MQTRGQFSWAVRAYTAGLLGIAGLTWWAEASSRPSDHVPATVLLVVWTLAVALTAVLPVRWIGWDDPVEIKVTEVFGLVALFAGPSLSAAIAITALGRVAGSAVTAALGDGVLRFDFRPTRVLFGVAQQTIGVVAAAFVLRLAAYSGPGDLLDEQGFLAITGAVVAFVFVGDLLVVVLRAAQRHPELGRLAITGLGYSAVTSLIVTTLAIPVAVTAAVGDVVGVIGTLSTLTVIAFVSWTARRRYLAERTLSGMLEFSQRAARAGGEEEVHALLAPIGRYLLDRDLEVSPVPNGEASVDLQRASGESGWLIVSDRAPGSRPVAPQWERAVLDSLVGVTGAFLDTAAARERTRKLADHDALTGLVNRRRFDEDARRVLGRAERAGTAAVTVLYVDLNDFKRVNDEISHDAGDEVLAEAARRLERTVRPGDVVSRRGGDEFTVLIQGPMGTAAQRCREALADLPYGVSASVGGAQWPQDGTAYADVLAAADARMYEDKGARRR